MKRMLTGIKPTGKLHLGNYVGAIKQLEEYSKDYEVFLMIADAHSMTFPRNASVQYTDIHEMIAALLSFDLDLNQICVYRQVDISPIFELYWILNCFCNKGLLNRGHAFKSQLENEKEDGEIGVGLYTYAILMASDILSMDADVVPVGQDQKQHLEICRDLAMRVNHFIEKEGLYNNGLNNGLKIPEIMIADTPILVGTDGRKMSKSYGNYIPVFGTTEELRKSVFSVVTNSQSPTEPKEPEILFELFSTVSSQEDIKQLKADYAEGISWKDAKDRTFQALENFVKDKREKFEYWMNNKDKVQAILDTGAQKASEIAAKKVSIIKNSLGFGL